MIWTRHKLVAGERREYEAVPTLGSWHASVAGGGSYSETGRIFRINARHINASQLSLRHIYSCSLTLLTCLEFRVDEPRGEVGFRAISAAWCGDSRGDASGDQLRVGKELWT